MTRSDLPPPPPDILLVGLGNPGPEYARTRHNVGWMVLEELAGRWGTHLDRRRWNALLGQVDRDGRRVWLLQPQTYMNLSGQAAQRALRDLEIPVDQVWVVYDEMDLPMCRLRIRQGGSAAGHNGIRSLMGSLRNDRFVRFRVGVGRPGAPRAGVAHVLGRFSRREQDSLPAVVGGTADAVELALGAGLERAMEVYNRAGSLGCEEIP